MAGGAANSASAVQRARRGHAVAVRNTRRPWLRGRTRRGPTRGRGSAFWGSRKQRDSGTALPPCGSLHPEDAATVRRLRQPWFRATRSRPARLAAVRGVCIRRVGGAAQRQPRRGRVHGGAEIQPRESFRTGWRVAARVRPAPPPSIPLFARVTHYRRCRRGTGRGPSAHPHDARADPAAPPRCARRPLSPAVAALRRRSPPGG